MVEATIKLMYARLITCVYGVWLLKPEVFIQRTRSYARRVGHTAYTRAHLISSVGGAIPPTHNHTHFMSLLPFLWPHSLHNCTGVFCHINYHGLTFSSAPGSSCGVKGHIGWGTLNN